MVSGWLSRDNFSSYKEKEIKYPNNWRKKSAFKAVDTESPCGWEWEYPGTNFVETYDSEDE